MRKPLKSTGHRMHVSNKKGTAALPLTFENANDKHVKKHLSQKLLGEFNRCLV